MTMTAESRTADQAALPDGRIVAIVGPVVDVEFPAGSLPELDWALTFETEVAGETTSIVAEVAQHIGESRVRAIAMKPTDGLKRGAPVKNLGHGIQVPVGPGTLGHVFNVIGEPLDTKGQPVTEGIVSHWEIHRPAPPFADLDPE
ncbi:MAG: F-type H+/Na+-transporting ATPase subunit beta, partial [Acidimicrobiaceae bacterium]|nr:F-type H+/Na+-transporting ATPase subunit beta [Acidimicrobiaceae bacterium]